MAESYESYLAAATAELQAARHQLSAEIARYPAPIAGCDAQFNRLLSDRRRIEAALGALASQPFVPTPRMLSPRPDVARG